MFLIAGLGNPGKAYQFTRHNLGFLILQDLAAQHQIPLTRKKFKSFYGQGEIEGQQVLLVLPQTYMNLSGEAVGNWVRYAHLPVDRLIIVHDDLDLLWGRLRIAAQGGAGGHKGVLSVIEHLKTRAFLRVRAGVGRPPERVTAEDYVLAPIPGAQRPELTALIERGRSAVEHLLREGPEKTMTVFNDRRSAAC
ncbi:MAG: aminoacyl-tRNA hydrolase [Deltaproteobacteria bacterium]|nr:aminoacyl-tRNA hydrolase [Deltaproteobacteria bacterium]